MGFRRPRLRKILARERGVELTNQEAWGRAIELVALGRALVEADMEEQDRHDTKAKRSETPEQGRLPL